MRPVFDAEEIQDAESGNGNENGTDVCAQRQRLQQVLHRCAFFGANEEDAEQRQEYTHGGNQHRSNDGAQLYLKACNGEGSSTEGGS